MPRILLEDACGEFIVDRSKPLIRESLASGASVTRIPGRLSICDTRNGNNRRYPKRVWEKNLAESSPLQDSIRRNAAFGLLEHPADGKVDLRSNIAVLTTKAKLENQDVVGEVTVLNTPDGQKLMTLIEAGYNPLVSSRGFGSLTRASDGVDEVQDDYVCEGWDVVMTPSFAEAQLVPARGGAAMTATESERKKLKEAVGETIGGKPGAESVEEFAAKLKTMPPAERRAAADAWLDAMPPQEQVEKAQALMTAFQPQQVPEKPPVRQAAPTTPTTSGVEEFAAKLKAMPPAEREAALDAWIDAQPPAERQASFAGLLRAAGVVQTPSRAVESLSGKSVSATPKTPTTMDIKLIKESVQTLQAQDPAKLTPTQFAEGLAKIEALHEQVEAFSQSAPAKAYESLRVHTQLERLSESWATAASKETSKNAQVREHNLKLSKVLKAVVESGLVYKKTAGEKTALVGQLVTRGRAWKARAESLEAKLKLTEKRANLAYESLDELVKQYNEATTTLGRRVIQLEFASKAATPEIAKLLSEATKPKHLVAIREKLEAKPGTPAPAASGTPAPAASGTPAPAASGTPAPVGESLTGPHSMVESLAIVRRLSASAAVAE